jgi:hypothetical protein
LIHCQFILEISAGMDKLLRRKQRGVICRAGLDPASSLHFWILAFAEMMGSKVLWDVDSQRA